MSTFKCTNPKNYALTLNKPYEVLEDEGETILIVNDKNKAMRYYKNLFAEEVEEIPVAAPPRTENDVVNSLNVGRNENNITVSYNDLDDNNVTFSIGITRNDSHISCGVKEFDGLNNIMSSIEDNVSTEDSDMELLKETIFKRVLRIITHIIVGNCRYILCSTNRNDDYEDYFMMLNQLAVSSTPWALNPNSNNHIKVWILERN